MSNLQALIFDLDGTLADTEKVGHRIAFNRAFAEAGLDWEWSSQFYGQLLAVSGGKERIHHYLSHYCPDFTPPVDVDQFVADLHGLKSKFYQQLLTAGNIPLRPGVGRLLKEAKDQGLRLAIATTSSLSSATALLESTLSPEGTAWFEVIAAGDIVPDKKPAPDIYFYLLESMALAAEDCLVFEDSAHGLAAASRAGLPTVITVNDYTQDQDFTEALLVLDHLGEPQKPFTVLAGDSKDQTYLDLALARSLSEA